MQWTMKTEMTRCLLLMFIYYKAKLLTNKYFKVGMMWVAFAMVEWPPLRGSHGSAWARAKR